MAEQYIFTIEGLTKAYGKREVLKNIWLAFYPGAKIGVIGGNGAGKSTLLRVMALVEKDFLGGVRPAPRITIGFVPQEPRLDETKDVRGNLEEAVAPTRALLQRHEELSNKLSEPLDQAAMEKTLEDLGAFKRPSTRSMPGNSTGSSKSPWTPCVCRRLKPPPPRCPAASAAAWPCARYCCKGPTCCCWTSQPITSTLNRSPGWNATCKNIRGPWWPSRTTATSLIMSPGGSWNSTTVRAFPGKATTPRGSIKSSRDWPRRRSRSRPGARHWPASWNGHAWRRGHAWPKARPDSTSTKSWPARNTKSARTNWSCKSLPDRIWATWSCGPSTCRKGYGDNLLMEDLVFDLPRGGIVGVIGPNGAGKTTLFRMIVGQEKPDAGAAPRR